MYRRIGSLCISACQFTVSKSKSHRCAFLFYFHLQALNDNRTIGISTGGVAEVFETNTSQEGDEVVVLKSRKGIIKLAFRTGASLVPCYFFGNTHLLSLWTGGSLHGFFRKLSRKVGERC